MNKFLKALKSIVGLLLVFLLIAAVMCGVDSFTVFAQHKKPLFTPINYVTSDGSSERYIGFCYSFIIDGDFETETSRDGVTSAQLKIFGFHVAEMP